MPSDTLAAVFVLAGGMTVIAQQKPDFSGGWKLNVQASTLSPIVAPAAQSGVLRIEHHEPRFTAHQTIVLDGKPFESGFELLSDGREVATTDNRGLRVVSTYFKPSFFPAASRRSDSRIRLSRVSGRLAV
jgi:hypothetical protein